MAKSLSQVLMYHLLDLLRRSPIVEHLDITNLIDEGDIQVFHARAELIDSSVLFVRELVTLTDSKYSYHWQAKSGVLICRWDNAPHHRRIKTFPHHKHIRHKDNVTASEEITLETALAVIERMISRGS